MQMVSLKAQARSTTSVSARLRGEGKVPCVLYGNAVEHQQLQCDYNEIYKAFVKAGESVLVELAIGSTKVPVLFHALQFDPQSDRITHVDFFAVDMNKKIDAHIPIKFIGESLAVKEKNAVFVTVHDHISVECLPADLPHHVEADISSLLEFGDSISVASIILPKGVTLMEDMATMIATVQEPRREEVVEVAPVAGEAVEGAAAASAEGAEGAAEGAAGEANKKEPAKK